MIPRLGGSRRSAPSGTAPSRLPSSLLRVRSRSWTEEWNCGCGRAGRVAATGTVSLLRPAAAGAAGGVSFDAVFSPGSTGVARARSEASGRTEHVYTDTRYAAGTWGRERRVVIKAEVVRLKGCEPRDNPRFVVTNLLQSSRFVLLRAGLLRPRGHREPDRGEVLLQCGGRPGMHRHVGGHEAPPRRPAQKAQRQAVDRIVHRYRRLGAARPRRRRRRVCGPDCLSTVPEAQAARGPVRPRELDAGRPEGPLRADRRAARRFAGPRAREPSPTLSALRAYREHRAAGRRGVPPDAPLDPVGAGPRSVLGANRVPRRPRRGGRAAEGASVADAFDRFLEGLADNRQVAFDDDGWRLKTDAAEQPDPAQSDSLAELHRWLDALSRSIRLADLLIKVLRAARRDPRPRLQPRPLHHGEGHPRHRLQALKYVSDWRLVEENQRAAAGHWGDGTPSASDGQRFAMGARRDPDRQPRPSTARRTLLSVGHPLLRTLDIGVARG